MGGGGTSTALVPEAPHSDFDNAMLVPRILPRALPDRVTVDALRFDQEEAAETRILSLP